MPTHRAPGDPAGRAVRAGSLGALFAAGRPQQWIKNTLLFVPLLAAHGPFDATHLGLLLAAFLSFSLAASSMYLVNDVLDVASDRAHEQKRHRPVASGRLAPSTAILSAVALLLAALFLAATLLPPRFLTVLGLYVVLSTTYSLRWKRVFLIDVFVLSTLYTLRIFAGGAAVAVALSAWLIGLSVFLFLSLAFLKRYGELLVTRLPEGLPLAGRGYEARDLDVLLVVGPASGMLSVLVLTLYIHGDLVREGYRRPEVLWLAAPALLYWILRLWFLAHRGRIADDPLLFAVTDPVSYGALAWILGALLAAGPI